MIKRMVTIDDTISFMNTKLVHLTSNSMGKYNDNLHVEIGVDII